jgi:hypothetical protein
MPQFEAPFATIGEQYPAAPDALFDPDEQLYDESEEAAAAPDTVENGILNAEGNLNLDKVVRFNDKEMPLGEAIKACPHLRDLGDQAVKATVVKTFKIIEESDKRRQEQATMTPEERLAAEHEAVQAAKERLRAKLQDMREKKARQQSEAEPQPTETKATTRADETTRSKPTVNQAPSKKSLGEPLIVTTPRDTLPSEMPATAPDKEQTAQETSITMDLIVPPEEIHPSVPTTEPARPAPKERVAAPVTDETAANAQLVNKAVEQPAQPALRQPAEQLDLVGALWREDSAESVPAETIGITPETNDNVIEAAPNLVEPDEAMVTIEDDADQLFEAGVFQVDDGEDIFEDFKQPPLAEADALQSKDLLLDDPDYEPQISDEQLAAVIDGWLIEFQAVQSGTTELQTEEPLQNASVDGFEDGMITEAYIADNEALLAAPVLPIERLVAFTEEVPESASLRQLVANTEQADSAVQVVVTAELEAIDDIVSELFGDIPIEMPESEPQSAQELVSHAVQQGLLTEQVIEQVRVHVKNICNVLGLEYSDEDMYKIIFALSRPLQAGTTVPLPVDTNLYDDGMHERLRHPLLGYTSDHADNWQHDIGRLIIALTRQPQLTSTSL